MLDKFIAFSKIFWSCISQGLIQLIENSILTKISEQRIKWLLMEMLKAKIQILTQRPGLCPITVKKWFTRVAPSLDATTEANVRIKKPLSEMTPDSEYWKAGYGTELLKNWAENWSLLNFFLWIILSIITLGENQLPLLGRECSLCGTVVVLFKTLLFHLQSFFFRYISIWLSEASPYIYYAVSLF